MKILGLLVEGCVKPRKSLEAIASKHNVSLDRVKQELAKGAKIELEHTGDSETAETIASHHLDEMIDYYDRLKKVETK